MPKSLLVYPPPRRTLSPPPSGLAYLSIPSLPHCWFLPPPLGPDPLSPTREAMGGFLGPLARRPLSPAGPPQLPYVDRILSRPFDLLQDIPNDEALLTTVLLTARMLHLPRAI